MDLHQDFKEFIGLLNAHEVNYLVVGGFAVGMHGRPRYTGDIDFWIAISNENADKIVAVLKEFGFGGLGLASEDFLKEDAVIQLGFEPVRIDILTSLTGLTFQECFAKSVEVTLDELKVRFIGLEDLIKNKSLTGRKRDLGDVEDLER